ncbi:MAG: FAD-dependent oxidoreductase [Microscillaceae bacterium]|nr:FAD-dependent oxidoreductase [Microscillaceae bacterium]
MRWGALCVNNGCTPTKTLVASAKVIHQAQRGDFFGFETGPVQVNFPAVMARMNKVRHGSREGLTRWMESSPNVELLRGWGTFLGPHTLAVNGQPVEAKNIYINVGTHPFTPPIPGLDQVPFLDNASLLELKELPAHLLIVGGGYIGVEFAQIFRRLGAKVSLVQGGAQLMPQEDADVAQAIQAFLEEEGIQIFCQSQVEAVRPVQGQIELLVKSPAGLHMLQGSHLLLATGRRPNTARLQLEKAGIQTDARGFIVVDDFCQTNVPGVFALGDVNGQGAFTHTSVNDAEIVLDFLLGRNIAVCQSGFRSMACLPTRRWAG